MTSLPPEFESPGRSSGQGSASPEPAAESSIPASARSAPDLSAMAGAPGAQGTAAAGQEAGQGAPTYRVDITTGEQFQRYAQLSGQGPVLFALYRGSDQAAVTAVDELTEIVDRAGGRFLLAAADIDQSPEIAQALQAATSLTVIAMIGGRPAPLYDSPVPAQQAEAVLGQVLQLAQQAQATGTFEPVGYRGEPEEKPLPPLHQKAQDALEAGNYDEAEAAYRQALNEQPADHDAKIGLAQVGLLSRVSRMDGQQVRAAAAENPDDLTAQLEVADLDVAGGHVEDAFNRLISLVRRGDPETVKAARERLLELFDVVGSADERVVAARASLMRALF